MIRLYCMFLQEEPQRPLEQNLLLLVDPEKRDKVLRYHHEIDRKLSLYADLLVRILATGELFVANRDIVWGYTNHHKPYLEGVNNWYFNVSHTRNAITVCTADNEEVGVDIEKSNLNEMEIAKRFFTTNEIAYILDNPCPAQGRFAEIWTKKEAYIKYIGKGLHIPLSSFDTISGVEASMIRSFTAGAYTISVCSPAITGLDCVTVLSIENFLDMCKALEHSTLHSYRV